MLERQVQDKLIQGNTMQRGLRMISQTKLTEEFYFSNLYPLCTSHLYIIQYCINKVYLTTKLIYQEFKQ